MSGSAAQTTTIEVNIGERWVEVQTSIKAVDSKVIFWNAPPVFFQVFALPFSTITPEKNYKCDNMSY